MTNFVIDSNGNLVYAHSGGYLGKWSNTPVARGDVITPFEIKTADIDFGQPSQVKQLYKVIISYKNGDGSVALNYSPNGMGAWETIDTLGQTAVAGQWVTESFTIPTDKNKVYSACFSLTTSNSPFVFELNDISIVYRLRNPGFIAPEIVLDDPLPDETVEDGADIDEPAVPA